MSNLKVLNSGSKNTEARLYVIKPDLHAPYHDVFAFALFLKIAKILKPYGLIDLGDLADMERFSRFRKISGRYPIRAELNAADLALSELESLNVKEKWMTEGNHEIRFNDWRDNFSLVHLEDHLYQEEIRELQLTKPQQAYIDFFQLKERGWNVVKYGDVGVVGNLVIAHFLGKSYMSQTKLLAALGRLEGHSLIVGHSHQQVSVGFTTYLSKLRVHANTFGWMGRKEAALYRTHFENTVDWPLGLGIAWMYPQDKRWEIHPVQINPVNYTCRIFGTEYELTPKEKKEAQEKWSEKALMDHKLSMFKKQIMWSKYKA